MAKRIYSSKEINKITGASRHKDIKIPFYYAPPFLDMLKDELLDKLKSSGGRPTIPGWNVVRKIRFSDESWRKLEKVSSEWGKSGQTVSPGQVASVILQGCLSSSK